MITVVTKTGKVIRFKDADAYEINKDTVDIIMFGSVLIGTFTLDGIEGVYDTQYGSWINKQYERW